MPNEAEAIVKHLASIARRRKEAEARAAQWREETDQLILAGVAAGVPKQVLARESGLTRQTVYTVILRGERS